MLDELQLRNLFANTVDRYTSAVEQFACYFGKSPEKPGATLDQVWAAGDLHGGILSLLSRRGRYRVTH